KDVDLDGLRWGLCGKHPASNVPGQIDAVEVPAHAGKAERQRLLQLTVARLRGRVHSNSGHDMRGVIAKGIRNGKGNAAVAGAARQAEKGGDVRPLHARALRATEGIRRSSGGPAKKMHLDRL